ncbi:hypothetical protein [Paenarthrobacter sp. CAP02]|uniref:hypothetical protein n=1 Tax=Paenarthrobacter sp. CAP02 TaxID=3158144 RepID=UPI0032DA2E81
MSVIMTVDSLKMIRETMCLAEHALHVSARTGSSRPSKGDFARIQRILDDIDRQRPLGSNGKHGNLHTQTCGCES